MCQLGALAEKFMIGRLPLLVCPVVVSLDHVKIGAGRTIARSGMKRSPRTSTNLCVMMCDFFAQFLRYSVECYVMRARALYGRWMVASAWGVWTDVDAVRLNLGRFLHQFVPMTRQGASLLLCLEAV